MQFFLVMVIWSSGMWLQMPCIFQRDLQVTVASSGLISWWKELNCGWTLIWAFLGMPAEGLSTPHKVGIGQVVWGCPYYSFGLVRNHTIGRTVHLLVMCVVKVIFVLWRMSLLVERECCCCSFVKTFSRWHDHVRWPGGPWDKYFLYRGCLRSMWGYER